MSSTSTNMETEAKKTPKKTTGGSSTSIAIGVMVLLLIAAAVAVPLGIIYGTSDNSDDSDVPTVQVSFTVSGDISDFDTTEQNAILASLSTAAGFATLPAGSTLTLASASVLMTAIFPVTDEAASTAAKASLQNAMPDQATAQTLLAAAVPTIVLESTPAVKTGEEASAPPPPPFALNGHWASNYGEYSSYTDADVVSISHGEWGSSKLLPIVTYGDNYYVIQRPASDTYNPKKFQKIMFHSVSAQDAPNNAEGTIGICTVISNAETEAEAVAADGVGVYYTNRTGPGGCGQFSHTFITPYTIEVAGSWTTASGAALTISSDSWRSVTTGEWGADTLRTIYAFSSNAAIAQMPADDTYNPSKWVKIEWHDKTDTSFAYCTTIYNSDTLLGAVTYDSVGEGAYNSANATHGCGTSGFSHSVATKN